MVEPPTQLLHGLRLSSEVVVSGACHGHGETADFEVRLDPPALPDDAPPPGELVAALEEPAVRYAAGLNGECLIARFFGTADFEVDFRRRSIVARPAPGRGESMVPVMLAGNVLALVLGLRGAAVLHASAIELDGAAVAFAGPTGAGKSTVAALMCATGAALVSDDAARVEERDGELLVHCGPHVLRLRPEAAVLADRVPGRKGKAADDRVTVVAPAAHGDMTRLGAVVFPRWLSDVRRPSAVRLPPRAALELLLRCPRVIGWRVPGPIQAHFDASARLARTLPAFDLELPRGRLDDPGLAAGLRDALAEAGALEAQTKPR